MKKKPQIQNSVLMSSNRSATSEIVAMKPSGTATEMTTQREGDLSRLVLCGHEIGHASMVYWRKESLHDTYIEVTADGATFYRRLGSNNITELMVKIAGPLVEFLMHGQTPQSAIRFASEYKDPQSDSFQIRRIVREYCNGVDSRKFQFQVQEQIRAIIQQPTMWLAINQAAEKLFQADRITGEEIETIFKLNTVPTMFDSPQLIEWIQSMGTFGLNV